MKNPDLRTIDDVINFAHQRHKAWEGKKVTDEIILRKKFTNVFRVLDRGSQYALELMNMYDTVSDRAAFSYFYRQVNRPDTMDKIIAANDDYLPTLEEITDPEWIDDVVRPIWKSSTGEFLNGAYMILIVTGSKLNLIEKMKFRFPQALEVLSKLDDIPVLEDRYHALRTVPGLGPFLSMQICTDLGYCEGEPDQENDFIIPGPGALKGIAALGKQHPVQVIKDFPADELPTLPFSGGRPPSLMDIQNVFCEFSKYVRYDRGGINLSAPPYQRHTPFDVTIPSHFIQPKEN